MSSPNTKPEQEKTQRPSPEWSSARWWAKGLSSVLIAFLLTYLPIAWFAARYRIWTDAVLGQNCLPYRTFLVDLKDRHIRRGDYIVFSSRQMQPFYPNGTRVAKLVAGIPGDHILVNAQGVWVNEKYWGELTHVSTGARLWKMGRRATDYRRDERVPDGHFWMMGTKPRSYDSRYWGYITDEQVVGRAIPLW